MKYLHEQVYENNLVKRWANEIPDSDTDNAEYETPTYQIRKIGTFEYYDVAIDIINSELISRGLTPRYYEATNKQIEQQERENE